MRGCDTVDTSNLKQDNCLDALTRIYYCKTLGFNEKHYIITRFYKCKSWVDVFLLKQDAQNIFRESLKKFQ